MNTFRYALFASHLMLSLLTAQAAAQTGVSEDRVSLPEGPGSLEGVGENIGINTNMGSMTYAVAVKAPAGFPAVTPDVGLSYSSSAGEGVLGVGWSMAMPAIERMTFKRLPLYQSDDDFCVDGSNQLIRLPGTEPAIYRSRFESGFVRYTWLGEGEGAEGYWLAEYPDGTRAYFGATAEGSLVPNARVGGAEGTFRYHLVEKVDVYGHVERWRYQKSGNYALPVGIDYVFVDGQPTYRIEMTYEERRDEEGVAYISDGAPGFELLLTQRLARIDIKSRGATIRSHALSYEPYADSGGFTRLVKVETFGAEGGLYPIAFDFEYSQALGGACEGQGCDRPFVMDMGTIGANLAAGRATLLDINGDALPDVIDASEDGAHRFFINIAREDGTAAFDTTARDSAVGTRAGHPLGSATVQTLDVNGDGFSDLINAGTGEVLINTGGGDWDAQGSEIESNNIAAALSEDFNADEGGLQALRFIDFNNDKRIDLMRATRAETLFFENRGPEGFEVVDGVNAIGAGFEEDSAQLADMNGDGNLDIVRVQLGGISYRLNLGWGRWGDWVDIAGLPIGEGQIETAELEDINGDALADLVVVQGATVTYALNNNSASFDAPIALTSNDVNGELPLREPTVTVLYADMNANGSSDVVWITAQGQVTALDLFPERPNLMTRITNNIGMVTDITYTTAAREMARDGGIDAWRYKLPSPMNVVKRKDEYDLLTELHEVSEYSYHEGFYDGVEKQFRGFERVETRLLGDETVEEGLTREVFDVGAEDTYRNGLLLSTEVASSDRELNETRHTYGDCDVAEVPDGTSEPIRHICPTATEVILKEGQREEDRVTTRRVMDYDGYGNVTLESDFGVISVGGGCEPCGERGPDDFGAPCGDQCLGDEQYTETEYVLPGEDTQERWITGAAFRIQTYGRPDSPLRTETLMHYDGPDFVGLPLGQLDQGKPTRTTVKVSPESEDVIQTARHRFDAHGNVIELLDPLGEPGGNTHRRVFVFDDTNLRVTRAEILLEDNAGNPYRLRREMLYEPRFDRVFEGTPWLRVADAQVVSAVRAHLYDYDEFGRPSAHHLPGNDTGIPDEAYVYDLQSPVSRIIGNKRSERGGALDIQVVNCLDGRGRSVQTRTRIAPDLYQVSMTTLFNTRSKQVAIYQPYTSDSDECDVRPPEGTLAETFRYDASLRLISRTRPDEGIFGEASVLRRVYGPLSVRVYDYEDTDPSSPHFDTPEVTHFDGMGRTVAFARHLTPTRAATTALHYDSLGHMSGYTDPNGNRKHQSFDLLGRVTRILDPNSAGETTFEYNDAGSLVRQVDDRGVVTLTEFDGVNRALVTWDEADEQGTRIERTYDFDPDCAACTHGENKLVTTTYPGIVEGTRDSEQLGFDLRGRPIHVGRSFGELDFDTSATYDNADRLLTTTYPDGRTIERTHDLASRLTSISGFVDTIGYSDRDQMDTLSCADGTLTTMDHDDMMRMTRLSVGGPAGPLQSFAYTLDRMSNILTIEDTVDARPDKPRFGGRFVYDAWYRSTSVTYDPGGAREEAIAIAFDDIDNLREVSASLGAASPAHIGALSYDSFAPNAATEVGGATYSYDEAGNVVQRGAQRYTWDFLGRMTGASGEGSPASRMVYGGNQLRIAMLEADQTTLYANREFEVRDGIATLYVSMDKKRVARVESAALATRLYTDEDEDGRITATDAWLSTDAAATGPMLWSSVRRLLLETGPDEGVTFLHRDHLGSITLATGLVDGELSVLGHRNFTPTGALHPDRTGYVDDYGFTGQEHDRSTGLIHFEYRYLDPRAGRWMSIDPAFATTTLANAERHGEATTAYAYVAGNFMSAFDPTGLLTRKAHTKKASKIGKALVKRRARKTAKERLKWRGDRLFTRGTIKLSAKKKAELGKKVVAETGGERLQAEIVAGVGVLRGDAADQAAELVQAMIVVGFIITSEADGIGKDLAMADTSYGARYTKQAIKSFAPEIGAAAAGTFDQSDFNYMALRILKSANPSSLGVFGSLKASTRYHDTFVARFGDGSPTPSAD